MRISSGNIEMESARSYSTHLDSRESTMVMVGTAGLLSEEERKEDAAGHLLVGEEARKKYDGESSFEEKKNALREKLNEMSSYSRMDKLSHIRSDRGALSVVKQQCMHQLVSLFLGETRKWDCTEVASEAKPRSSNGLTELTETVYHQKEIYFEEREDTSFSTTGTVRTADGREISFDVQVEMSRSFSAYYQEHYAQIQTRMVDPLVINLEGKIAQLEDQTFFFDIDMDGEEDRISRLSSGSGYLALDKNQDGIINDGSELFGTRSGDGFADLAAYDSDGNGWIDEGDEIWEKLLIWTKDEEGQDRCFRLTEKGVGALALANTATEFAVNGIDNTVNGRIRKTGIFLYENGAAGTLQHLDLAKKEPGFDVTG
ncbi:MAG: hypothetical protein IKM28_02650 [Lachnospiraceae bacterium]|nr:hypothetical protein [Lachnospiraceae bacterium]